MQEIERKFLVKVAPDLRTIAGSTRLRQGYLAVDGEVEARLREADGTTTLAIKGGRGLARTEVEFAVEPNDAAALWPFARERSVTKLRHRLPLEGGQVAELDVYDGRLAGLMTVEVEFDDAAAAAAFAPPEWFGEEVTGDGRWSNAQLAQRGCPG